MNPVLVKRITSITAALLLLCAHSAQAERADRDKPVNLESDTVEVNDQTKISTYQGNVRLTQGTLLITGDKLVVTQDDDGFSKSQAYGNPTYFKQKRDGGDELTEGWAQRIDYDAKRDKVEMFTAARIKRGSDEVRGSYITYDGVTESYRVQGGKESATEYNPKGRVRAVIQPKKRSGGAIPSDGGLPLKPTESVGQVQ